MKKQKPSIKDWVAAEASHKKRKCRICLDEARPIVQEIIRAIKDHGEKAQRISVMAIFDKISELSPGFADRIGFYNFRSHLNHHEPDWHLFKGERRNLG